MARTTYEDRKAYRVVIVYDITTTIGTTRYAAYFGPHISLRQARQIKTRQLREIQTWYNNPTIVDAYVERADNWNRVLDTDKE